MNYSPHILTKIKLRIVLSVYVVLICKILGKIRDLFLFFVKLHDLNMCSILFTRSNDQFWNYESKFHEFFSQSKDVLQVMLVYLLLLLCVKNNLIG